MAEAIPPSPYPVYNTFPKPSREIYGPYIASKPAYQIFADMARKGGSIADYIAADMQSQAKAEGRPDPVKELPENRKYWFNNGEMEPLPEWPNPADAPRPLAPAAAPVPAVPAIAPAPLAGPSLAPPPAASPAPTAAPLAQPAAGDERAFRLAASRLTGGRAAGAREVSHVQRALANASYIDPARQPRVATRPQTRGGDNRTV